MSIVLFMKSIIDMFYQYKVLDMILMYIVIIVFIKSIKNIKAINVCDILIIIIMGLYFIAFIKNPRGIMIFIKIVSSFVLYFIGRAYYKKSDKYSRIIKNSYYVVLIINLALLFTGNGFILWGEAKTFKGMYFFKTDLAAAMMQAVIFIYFIEKNKLLRYGSVFIVAPIIIVLTNSRMYLMILMVIYYIFYLENKEKKSKIYFKINIKMLIKTLIILMLGIYLIAYLLDTELFRQLGFIGFEINHISDLFNPANTQGRNVIWQDIINYFNNQSFFEQLMGIDLVSDSYIGTSGHNAHNNYLKILFSTGYVGIILFGILITKIIKKVNKIKDRQCFYITISLLAIYLINGISNNIIEFTQLTWIPMFYFGISISKEIEKSNEKEVNYEI